MRCVRCVGLLAQGGTSRNQKFTIRFLAGAWCVTCFVLVTAYSSVLISFVTSPNYKPLIQSLYDMPKNPQVKVAVNRGWSPDLLFTVSYTCVINNYAFVSHHLVYITETHRFLSSFFEIKIWYFP